MVAVLSLTLTVPVLAQSAGAGGQAQGQANGQAELKAKPATATANADAQAQANAEAELKSHKATASADAEAKANTEAELKARKSLQNIKEKGAKVSAEARANSEAKLEAAANKTDDEAEKAGEAKVAARLASEFKMSTDEIMAEKQELDCSWGQLMIAHSLDANSKADVTATQLMELRHDGTGWGQIAAGLGLKLDEAVSAVQTESRVAAGLAKPDGKVAVIHGEGARAGVSAGVGAGAGAKAGGLQAGAQTGVQTGLGVGVKIKP